MPGDMPVFVGGVLLVWMNTYWIDWLFREAASGWMLVLTLTHTSVLRGGVHVPDPRVTAPSMCSQHNSPQQRITQTGLILGSGPTH